MQSILVGIEGEGVAVENQLILATDQVAVNGRHARRLDAISQHLDPLAGLVEMAGRGVEDEQQFGAGLAGELGGALFPDIGTDVDAAAHAVQRDDAGFGAGLEIALLVEDFVVRQAHLAIGRDFPAFLDNRGGVVAGAIAFFRMPDDNGDAVDTGKPGRREPDGRPGRNPGAAAGLPADSRTTPARASAAHARRGLWPRQRTG